MPKCVAPKCANVKNRCQCPNPWVEYLSHAASERVTAGLSRLSLKEHVRGYRNAVKSGLFKPKSHRKPACKSDTTLLCDWRSKRGHKKSITRARRAPANKTTPRVPMIDTWPLDLLTLQSKLLYPFAEGTLKADFKGIPLVFKAVELSDDWDRRDFMWQTQNHFEIYKRMPSMVPRLMDAYFLKSGKTLRGVHIMERVPGITLGKLLKRERNNPMMMTQVASHLRQLFDAMRRHHVWHGDPHIDNMIVNVVGNKVVNIFIIDFESSVLDVDITTHNLYLFLEGPKDRFWIPYLRKAGIRFPPDVDSWDETKFEENNYIGLHDALLSKMKQDPPVDLQTVTLG